MKLRTKGERIFAIFNYMILSLAAFICLMPLLHVLAVSLSSRDAILTGSVTFWPIEFTLEPYAYVLRRTAFWRAFGVSLKRVVLGVSINMVTTITLGYALSKESRSFFGRTFYAWFFFITMLFNGGLIPGYVLLKELHLLDTIWALVLPGAVQVYYTVLMLNFFRQIPRDLEEAAFIDGAGHFRTMWQIYVPISMPSIATILLYCLVNHWNNWFDGLIFMNHTHHYPLQSFLQTVIVDTSQLEAAGSWTELLTLNDRNLKCAQIFVAMVPILLVYPVLQEYFVKGMVLGSVKG